MALACAISGAGLNAAGLEAADLVCGPAAVLLSVYALAAHRTAPVSVFGAAVVPVAGAAGVLATGAGIRTAGRLHRRSRARRRAVREYRAAAHTLLPAPPYTGDLAPTG